MDVEVDDSHAAEPLSLSDGGSDGDIREQAEPHRQARLGVMTRWPHRAERPRRLARRNVSNGLGDGPRSMARGYDTARRQEGVFVQFDPPLRRGGTKHGVDVGLAVNAQQVGCLDERRGVGRKIEGRIVQRLQHGAQPIRALGMALAGAVVEHGLVCV